MPGHGGVLIPQRNQHQSRKSCFISALYVFDFDLFSLTFENCKQASTLDLIFHIVLVAVVRTGTTTNHATYIFFSRILLELACFYPHLNNLDVLQFLVKVSELYS